VKEYLARKKHFTGLKTPARILLELAGSWEDDKEAGQIIAEIKEARKNSKKLAQGF